MLSVHLVQMDPQKRFLVYHMSSVYQVAGKNPSKTLQKNSEHLEDDLKTWDNPELLLCLKIMEILTVS